MRLGKRGGGAEVEGAPPRFIGRGGAAEKGRPPPKERGGGAEVVDREKEGGAVEKERGEGAGC